MSESAFPQLSSVEKVFYDLVWSPMLTIGENWVEGEVYVLSLPVIKQVDEAALKILTDWLYHQFCLLVDVGAIQLVGALRQATWESASEQLVIIAEEKGVNSDEYKQAQAAALVALSKFGRLGS